MADYLTKYPAIVALQDGRPVHLSLDDNEQRSLITETEADIADLRRAFEKEGFKESFVEEKKDFQIGNGFRKRLSEEWDMHIRFLELNQGKVSIDGEVETSTEYLEHVTKPQYWVSVLYEIHDILLKYGIQFKIWYKKAKNYVMSVIETTEITLHEVDGKIKWKPIAAGAAIGITAGLLIAYLLKK